MELNWHLERVLRPGSGTVRVTELGWQGHLNPSPSIKEEEEEQLVDEYLSPDKLELYIAYNNIADLSQVSLLEHLEILDLEGNNIDDLSQIQYLGLCTKLSTLTVEGNLVCLKPSPQSPEVSDYNYRAEVKKLIPHLKCLDEIPAHQTAVPCPCKMNKDWLLVKESIKDANLLEQASDSDSGFVTSWPCSSVTPTTAHCALASRPQTAQRPPSAHLLSGCSTLLEPTTCEEVLPEDDSSDLTHGINRVICGNPIKALHARRQKLGSAVMNLFQPLCPLSEHTYDSEEMDSINGEDPFAEQEASRKHHYQHLQAFQREKSPQVLKIAHSEEEEEEEEQNCSLSESSNEDQKETLQDIMEITPCSSPCQSHLSQSSSDSSHLLENALPTIIKHTLTPSPPKCASPASIQSVAGEFVRARHLKMPNSKKAALLKPQSPSPVNGDVLHHVVEKIAVLNLHRRTDTSSNVVGQRYRTCGTDSSRPSSGSVEVGIANNRAVLDRNLHNMINMHQPVVHSCPRKPGRFSVRNVVHPLAAKTTLQSLPNKPDISMTAQSKTPKL